MPTNPAIEVHEVTPDRADLVDALVEISAVTDAVVNPGDPSPTRDEVVGNAFRDTVSERRRPWVALLDGRPVGYLVLEREKDDVNGHVVSEDEREVHPDHLDDGVDVALLRHALAPMVDEGATSLMLAARDGRGVELLTRLGLTHRTVERCSRLRIDELDEDLCEQWLAEGEARTDGYRLVQIVGDVPDDVLEPYLEAHESMLDVPLDDLEYEVQPFTEERFRSRQAMFERDGLTLYSTLAIAPDGSGAGISELSSSRHRPSLAWQSDTGVARAHRGRSLGRWLKAANLANLRAHVPEVTVVQTWNATTNPWMLSINVAMGFRPHHDWDVFQGDLVKALAVLDEVAGA